MIKRLVLMSMFMVTKGYSQQHVAVDITSLKSLYTSPSDTLYMVHFFATWCKPCIKELPKLLALDSQNSKINHKLILVCLEDEKTSSDAMEKLALQLRIKHTIYLLNPKNVNQWINDIDPRWSGSLPMTLLKKRHKRICIERDLTQKDIHSIINSKK